MNLSDDLVFTVAGKAIRTNTTDGSDSSFVFVAGGGGTGAGRGGAIVCYGNEHGSLPGQILISGGTIAGGGIVTIAGGSGITDADIIFRPEGSERGRFKEEGLDVTGELDIDGVQGNVIIRDLSSVKATSDMGIVFDGDGSIDSGVVTSVDGVLISLAINVPEIGRGETAKSGGVFRFDTRTTVSDAGFLLGLDCFTLLGNSRGDASGTNPVSRMIVSIHDGRTMLVPNGGDVGIGIIPVQKLDVNGITLLRDKLAFTQTDLNEFIDSLDPNFMDYGATTEHRFNNDVNVTGDALISGAIIGNPDGTGGEDFIFGSSQKDDTGSVTQDLRMFFDKTKGAFRAGGTPSIVWDSASVGTFSIGLGLSTKASGDNGSVALGGSTEATGDSGAIAAGWFAVASGTNGAIALGNDTEASGNFGTMAMGRKIIVSGNTSVGIGLDDNTRTLAQNNTMAVMGGNVGFGTLTADRQLQVVGDSSFGDDTNDTLISPTGVLTMAGTARVLRSVDFEPDAVKKGGVGPADSTEDGFPIHDYDSTNDESVHIHWEIPHWYASGGEIHLHVEFFIDTAPGAADPNWVTWGVEYKKQSIGDNFDFDAGTTTVIVNTTLTTGTPANDKKIHSSAEIHLTTTGFEPMDVILVRIFRDADASEDGATDDFENDARVFNYHLMGLSDKLGQAS